MVQRLRRQRSEQYLTASQTFAQRRRQTIGRPQATQVFSGSSDLRIALGMG
jgi:hypothetical protein